MNGKKAKALRYQMKKHDAYKKDADYKAIKHKKQVYIQDPVTGIPSIHTVERVQLINTSKFTYRRTKKAYKNGEIVV